MTTATATANRSSHLQQPTSQRQDSMLDQELPPAYTPSPDVRHGETTIESGPARPFQTAPARSSAQASQTPGGGGGSGSGLLGSLWNQLAEQLQDIATRSSPTSPTHGRLTPQPTGGSWSSYPGRQARTPPPRGSRPTVSQSNTGGDRFLAPPPRHPPGSTSTTSNQTNTPSSDFARDFYAAGHIIPGEDSTTGRGSDSGAALSSALIPGKPTTNPTAGHPYLHNNQLLVYPRGYECEKCHNIGYKLPSLKPCKRCWPKYGKPFTGPLAYSFGEEVVSGTSTSNLQRPLPNPLPTTGGRHRHRNSYPGALPTPLLTPQPNNGSRLSSNFRSPPPPPPPQRFPGLLGQLSGSMSSHLGGGPPPLFAPVPTSNYGARGGNHVVYNAGDPRLGGRLCWRCDGQGTVSFMLLDREQCPVCGGIGRTF